MLFLSFSLILFSCTKKEELLVFTNAEFPPFEYMKGNKIAGIDVDIVNEIGKQLKRKMVIKNIEFASIVPAVQSGKADIGIAGMTITEERKAQVDFSIPYTSSEQYIISFSDKQLKTIEELKDKKVGVQIGTTGHILMEDARVNNTVTNLSVSGYSNVSIAVQELLIGRVDAVVVDKLPANVISKKHSNLATAKIGNTEEFYALCVKKGNTELLAQLNEILTGLIESGKIDEFTLQHTLHF